MHGTQRFGNQSNKTATLIGLKAPSSPSPGLGWEKSDLVPAGYCLSIVATDSIRMPGDLAGAWPRDCSRRVASFSFPAFVTLYIKIDQIMIGQMLGDEKVGIYSAAVRLTEMWYFMPMAITTSVFPAIVSAKKTGEAEYYNSIQKLYLLMVWLSIAVAIPITLFARHVVLFVFGQEYLSGATALSI